MKTEKPKKHSPSINSKQKGKRVELDLVHFLKTLGCPTARRSQQYAGFTGTSDITCDELSHFHIECKGTRDWCLSRGSLGAWKDQLRRDCPKDKTPVLFWKSNNRDWVCFMLMKDQDAFAVFLDAIECVNLLLSYANDTNIPSGSLGGRGETGDIASFPGFTNGLEGDTL